MSKAREIKFRAWHKEWKQMYWVDRIHWDASYPGVQLRDNDGGQEWVSWDDIEPLMQYINRKDKNGKEIYDGDIVQVPGAIPAQVYWDYGSWQLRNGSLTGGMIANFEEEDIEVIGNIYENPEILT